MIEAFANCPQCGWSTCDHNSIHEDGDIITFNCDDCGCEFEGTARLDVEINNTRIIERGTLHDEEEEEEEND